MSANQDCIGIELVLDLHKHSGLHTGRVLWCILLVKPALARRRESVYIRYTFLRNIWSRHLYSLYHDSLMNSFQWLANDLQWERYDGTRFTSILSNSSPGHLLRSEHFFVSTLSVYNFEVFVHICIAWTKERPQNADYFTFILGAFMVLDEYILVEHSVSTLSYALMR